MRLFIALILSVRSGKPQAWADRGSFPDLSSAAFGSWTVAHKEMWHLGRKCFPASALCTVFIIYCYNYFTVVVGIALLLVIGMNCLHDFCWNGRGLKEILETNIPRNVILLSVLQPLGNEATGLSLPCLQTVVSVTPCPLYKSAASLAFALDIAVWWILLKELLLVPSSVS